MAYRWNGVECDTYEELMQLQIGRRQAEVSAGVREEHAQGKEKPHSSGMYTITKKLDGKYHAAGRTQDSTERSVCDSMRDAESFLHGVAEEDGWTRDAVQAAIEVYEETAPVRRLR